MEPIIVLVAICMALVILILILVFKLNEASEYRKLLKQILVNINSSSLDEKMVANFVVLWNSIEQLPTKRKEEFKISLSLILYRLVVSEILKTTNTSNIEVLANKLKFAMDGTSVESLRSKYAFQDPDFVNLKQLLVERFTAFFQKEWEVVQSKKEQASASTYFSKVKNLHNSYLVLKSLFSETEIQGVVKHIEKMKEFALEATIEEIHAFSGRENYEDIILEYSERNPYLVDKKKVLQEFYYVFNKDKKPLT